MTTQKCPTLACRLGTDTSGIGGWALAPAVERADVVVLLGLGGVGCEWKQVLLERRVREEERGRAVVAEGHAGRSATYDGEEASRAARARRAVVRRDSGLQVGHRAQVEPVLASAGVLPAAEPLAQQRLLLLDG
eukprot:6181160-Pleurochrysis_carterae.AAC.1